MWDFLLYDVPWCNGSTTDFGSVGWGFESLRDNLGGSSVGRALYEKILVKESNSEPFSNCSDKAVVAGSSPALPTKCRCGGGGFLRRSHKAETKVRVLPPAQI